MSILIFLEKCKGQYIYNSLPDCLMFALLQFRSSCYLKVKAMNCSEEDLPDHIKKEIIAREIQALIGVDEPAEDEYFEDIEFDPYSLDSEVSYNLENKFHHGIKEPRPAYKNLKPAAKSVLECEYIRMSKNRFYTSSELSDVRTYVKVSIPGLRGVFYLPTCKLSELMKQNLHEYSVNDRLKTWSLILKFDVNYDFLKKNVKKR